MNRIPLLLLFAACSSSPEVPAERSGWRETEPPRRDLQCWVRWNDPKTTVCAPSLTATRGAAQ